MSVRISLSLITRRARPVAVSLALLLLIVGSLTLWSARARSFAGQEPSPSAADAARTENGVPEAAADGAPSGVVPAAAQTDETKAAGREEADEPVEYVRRGELGSRLRAALAVLGDRLERPGKERLSMTGTLSRAGESAGRPFVLIREFPVRLRLEERAGTNHHVVIHKGQTTERSATQQRDADDIETLVFDTAEHFFTAVSNGAAIRHLGDHFRLDEPSRESTSYDLYEVTEDVSVGAGARRQTKVYGLNSDTMLPGLVRYETERGGSPLRVEVRLGDWRRVGEQMIAHRIERLENGRVTLTLDILTAVVSARGDVRAFDTTTAN